MNASWLAVCGDNDPLVRTVLCRFCGEHAFDRIGGSQVDPMLSIKIMQCKQTLAILDQAIHRAHIFCTVFSAKD